MQAGVDGICVSSSTDGCLFEFLGKTRDEVSFGQDFCTQDDKSQIQRKSRKCVSFHKLEAHVELDVAQVASWFNEENSGDEEHKSSYRSGSWTIEDVESERRLWNCEDEYSVKKQRSSSADAPRRKSFRSRLRALTLAELGDTALRPENFVKPCLPLSTSGGTAAFFRVNFSPVANHSNHAIDKYIGKGCARAECEVTFYDDLRAAAKVHAGWAELTEVTLKCPGVCRLPCLVSPNTNEMLDLLLLENFNSGFECLRLCDIKLGEETAIANWQGKSRTGALQNKFIDMRTNSFGEGLRLEGMDNPPPALKMQLCAVTDEGVKVSLMRKKLLGDKVSQRVILQRLQSADFLASWLDVSALGQECERHAHSAAWSALEEMSKVVRTLAKVPWPQTWIGSSIALGLEVSEISHTPRVLVKLFDWGRSELYNEDKYKRLPDDRKEDCLQYWQQYVGAACRIHWELARIVAHRCCCSTWSVFAFELNSESLSVVRSLLQSNSSRQSQLLGVGSIKVHSKNHARLSECEVPLHIQGAGGVKQLAGKLVVQIEKVARGICGSTFRLTVSHATDMAQKPSGSTAIVVRVVAFRDEDDALIYVASRMQAEGSPLPRGRACAQSTPPCRIERDVLVWHSYLEFLSLGDDAVSRQKRLIQLVPECFEGAARTCDDMLWPVLLPPPFVSVEEGKAFSRLWSQNLVPWLGNWDACPIAWRGKIQRDSKDSTRSSRSSGKDKSPTKSSPHAMFPVTEVSPDGDSFGRAMSELAAHIGNPMMDVQSAPVMPMRKCTSDLEFPIRSHASDFPASMMGATSMMGKTSNAFVLNDVSDVPTSATAPKKFVLPAHLRFSGT